MRRTLDKTVVKPFCAVLLWETLVFILVVLVGLGRVKVQDRFLVAALISTTMGWIGLLLYLWRRKGLGDVEKR